MSAVPSNPPTYDRHDWNHWVDADGDCQYARQEVLVAESRFTVSYQTDRRCRVASGQWLALYSNVVVTEPGKLDVDHLVPLGNAHLSGGWRWNAVRRERYVNHLADHQHLIAVTASANRSKGARGPEAWKAEDRSYWCQYAVDWITIKATWELKVTQAEHDALVEMLDTCANPPRLTVSQSQQVNPTPVPTKRPALPPATPTPQIRTYPNCDAAQAAGERRVRGSKGSGRGFPQVDGAQRPRRRWRWRGVREVTAFRKEKSPQTAVGQPRDPRPGKLLLVQEWNAVRGCFRRELRASNHVGHRSSAVGSAAEAWRPQSSIGDTDRWP